MEKITISVKDECAADRRLTYSENQFLLIRALQLAASSSPKSLRRKIVERILVCTPFIKKVIAQAMPLGVFDWDLYAKYSRRISLKNLSRDIWYDLAHTADTLERLRISTRHLPFLDSSIITCELLYKEETCRQAFAIISKKIKHNSKCVLTGWFKILMAEYNAKRQQPPPPILLEIVQENAKSIKFAEALLNHILKDAPGRWYFQFTKYWHQEENHGHRTFALIARYFATSSLSELETILPLLDFKTHALIAKFCMRDPDKFKSVWTWLCERESAKTKFQMAERVYFCNTKDERVLYYMDDIGFETPFDLEVFPDDIIVHLLGHEKMATSIMPYRFLEKHPRFYQSLYIPARPNFILFRNFAKHLSDEQICKIDWHWALAFEDVIPEEFFERCAQILKPPEFAQLFSDMVTSARCPVEVDATELCAICRKYFDQSKNDPDDNEPDDCELIRKPCKHVFHTKCLLYFIHECPLCRSPFMVHRHRILMMLEELDRSDEPPVEI